MGAAVKVTDILPQRGRKGAVDARFAAGQHGQVGAVLPSWRDDIAWTLLVESIAVVVPPVPAC